MLVINLLKIKQNLFYIIILEKNKKQTKFIERIGYFQPKKAINNKNVKFFKIDLKRFKFWIKRGAKSTKLVNQFVSSLVSNDYSL